MDGEDRPLKLPREVLAAARLIAKGRRIRDVDRLVQNNRGRHSGWMKKSSPILEEDGEIIEYHWYENVDVGIVELKK